MEQFLDLLDPNTGDELRESDTGGLLKNAAELMPGSERASAEYRATVESMVR